MPKSKRKNTLPTAILTCTVAFAVIIAGILLAPKIFPDRVIPGLMLNGRWVGGLSLKDVNGYLMHYEVELLQRPVILTLRGHNSTRTLGELGFRLDQPATREALWAACKQTFPCALRMMPQLRLNQRQMRERVNLDFASVLKPPQNASLVLTPANDFRLITSSSGDGVDLLALGQEVGARVRLLRLDQPIELRVISSSPPVEDNEVEYARQLAARLLKEGFQLQFEDQTFSITPFTIRRLLVFSEQPDPANSSNQILGVTLDPQDLEGFLAKDIASQLDQSPVNARFTVGTDEASGEMKVTQFDVPQRGQALDIPASAKNILQTLQAGHTIGSLVVHIEEPVVQNLEDITDLGVTALLATGESDFVGSPANRKHNIQVGTNRFQGLLIAPDTEFSFLQYLGPVTAAAGFKPELVIKHNVTTPEYGGGLCQVSTTVFRAAAQAGLPITARRNHSYAVSYYGKPGFDATIYPPYTDFRFRNNTPGYLLVQTKIEGTKLKFEFWGSPDGRVVEIDGPHPYNRQPDGSVKAVLTQKVIKDGQTIQEKIFYSNYRSPKLFPKTYGLSNPPAPAPSPSPASLPKPSAT